MERGSRASHAGQAREGNETYHRDLAAFNPQRVKTVASMFRESLLLNNTPEDTYKAIADRAEQSLRTEVEFMEVERRKIVRPVSPKQREFLECVQRGIDEMSEIHPLTLRKIHYWIVSLTTKPLMLVCKGARDQERYRYRNDKSSYKALGRLLTAARYAGDIPMNVIDDPTRPEVSFGGFTDAANFIAQENENFLRGFHLDKQQGQERFIYVLPEKNTIIPEVKRACAPYYVPFCPVRGFAGPSVWFRIAQEFKRSRKKRITLLCISDYDPEGLELCDDAVRSLGMLIDPSLIDAQRVGLTREQVDAYDLAEDFNPAKLDSHQLEKFKAKTGGTKTWEVDALGMRLVPIIQGAIEGVMDMGVYDAVCERERQECEQITETRAGIAKHLTQEI